jgi:hypothetical protein
LVCKDFWGTEAALSLGVLAHNRIVLFERKLGWQEPVTLGSLCYWLFVTAGVISHAHGRTTIKLALPQKKGVVGKTLGENFVAVSQLQCSRKSTGLAVSELMKNRLKNEVLLHGYGLVGKRALFAVEGKDQETWAHFVQALEKHNGHRHAITQASMDMSQAYQNGVAEHGRNAQVVFDKFHGLKNANEAVDKVRRAELRVGGWPVLQALTQSQWLWRKNPEHLTEQEQARMAQIKDKNLGTAKAYQMRRVLQDIYRSADAGTAQPRLRIWCRWVRFTSTTSWLRCSSWRKWSRTI